MRALREKDYDDMAGRVVDRFMRGETKLADAAVAEAMQGQLNPDQIERLVQAANAMAFLRMMEDRKAQGAPDMTHEFDPVDTRGVLQQIIGQTPMGGEHPDLGLLGSGGEGHPEPHGMPPGMEHAEPHAGPDEGPLPDEMAAHRGDGSDQEVHVHGDDSEVHVHDDDSDNDNDGPFPKGEKQKAKDKGDKGDKDKAKSEDKPEKKAPPKPAEKDEQKEAAFRQRRMRKLAETLEDQFRQAELTFDEEYERLAREFKLASGAPRFDAFEKDAMALADPTHGAVVLNLLRQDRGLEPVAASVVLEKHAALADRHVSDDYPALRMFERLVKIASEADRVRRGAEYARAQCG